MPLGCGALAVAARGWPRGLVLPAWIFFSFWVPLCYLITPPALNVNLAHAPWPPLAALFPQLWMSWAFNAAASLVALSAHDAWLRRWRPEAAGRARADALPVLAALALLLFCFHCAEHLRRGELGDLLWAVQRRHAGAGRGCTSGGRGWWRWRRLAVGQRVALDRGRAGRGQPDRQRDFTHVGSLAVSIGGRALGLPPRSWLRATGGLALLVALSRLLTAPARNVNLAFAVSPGWQGRFGSHALYLTLLLLFAAAVFLAVERAWLRDVRRQAEARS